MAASSTLTVHISVGGLGSLGAGLMGLGGSGGSVAANAGILGSSSAGSKVRDSLGNNGMYASGGSRSLERGMGSMMDERERGMESRMSGGGNMYGSSGGGGGRMTYDYEHTRGASVDYDRGDRGGSDIFVKNVSCRTSENLL